MGLLDPFYTRIYTDMRRTRRTSLPKLTAGILVLTAASQSFAYDCSNLDVYAPGPIATGTEVQNYDKAYYCKVGGWCQQGGPYEPGRGWAWQEAWEDLGECDTDFNHKPIVEFDLPETVANGTNLQVTGHINDPDGVVQKRLIYINGELKSDYQALYGIFEIDYQWRPELGTHTMTIEVEDDKGATSSASDTITVTPNAIPQVNISQPGNKVDAGAPLEIVVDASDADGTLTHYDLSIYDYTLDGPQNQRQIDSGELNQQTTTISTTAAGNLLQVGNYILIATLTDNSGATETDAQIFEVSQISSVPVFNATIPSEARAGDQVDFTFTALPFKTQEYGIASITVDGVPLTVYQGWQSLPHNPSQWAYSGQAYWVPIATGTFEVVISLDHPDFPTPIVQEIHISGPIPSGTPHPTHTPIPSPTIPPTATPWPTPTVTPTPTPWPPTPTPTFTPTPLPTPMISISAPDFVEIDQTANFTVTVDEYNETGEFKFYVDGNSLNPNSLTWEDSPNPNSFVAKFSYSSSFAGTYPVQATVIMNSGVTVTELSELEVIYQCYTGGAEPWDPDAVYTSGDKVIYNYRVYEARFWTRGDNPETTHPTWGQWKLLGSLNCY